MRSHQNKMIVVFAGNPVDAEMVCGMLLEKGIQANMVDQLMGFIAPWHVSPGGFEPVKVEVPETQQENAIRLIQAFRKET